MREVAVCVGIADPGPACAQVSGSVTLLSDFRYRGTSLSDGLPTAQATWPGIAATAGMAGLQLTRVRFMYPGARLELQTIPYLGYVHRLRAGLSAEAACSTRGYSTRTPTTSRTSMSGCRGGQLRSRLSWTPHYFGQSPAWYAELDGSHALRTPWRVIGHVGVLQRATTPNPASASSAFASMSRRALPSRCTDSTCARPGRPSAAEAMRRACPGDAARATAGC